MSRGSVILIIILVVIVGIVVLLANKDTSVPTQRIEKAVTLNAAKA